MPHVIFVCTGNLCRSPMAERILRSSWPGSALTVTSMGTYAPENRPATEAAVQVCREQGLEISDHLSRPLNPDELDKADLVFTMDRIQKDFILLFMPRLRDKIFLLGAWPGKETRKSIIADPIGRNIKEFRKTYELIRYHIDRIIPQMVEYLR